MTRTTICSLLLLLLAAAPPLFGDESVEARRIEDLLDDMSLEEKIGQLALRGRGSTGSRAPIPEELVDSIRAGRVGGLINVMLPDEIERLQQIAVAESPHGIPLLVGRDVIHGLHAVAPIPLAQAATWNPALVQEGARRAAIDASAYGINWTFAPMLDIARDPRWGRIAESPGEDPVLASRIAEALVRGFQGEDLSAPDSIAACVKHFVAYGAAEGGRDYNTVSVSTADLHNIYLAPFAAAIRAGAASVMAAFNEINGVPASGNSHLLTEILREQWGFDGFVVADWNSVKEMIAHGFSVDGRDAARQAMTAGLDMEMTSTTFDEHLLDLVQAGDVPEAVVDEAVRRILRVKHRLGLFERDDWGAGTTDPSSIQEASLEVAQKLAVESAVLLRNENATLPVSKDIERLAVVGPMANSPTDQIGTWAFDGRPADSVTPLAALTARLGEDRIAYAPGLDYSRDMSRDGFADALAAARGADVAIVFAGEEAILSGEAHSRADIRLPGVQEELVHELAQTGTPIVLVLMAGRPLALHSLLHEVDAVLVAWHPGTMAGPALTELLLGDASPSGRLPVSWPKAVGQIPIYYNHKATGRPFDPERYVPIDEIPVGAWQSSLSNRSYYLDLGASPEFPFGYGLTYSNFDYTDLELSSSSMTTDGSLEIQTTVANTGSSAAAEVVQLYVRDVVGSRTRPVRQLVRFAKVPLEPGSSVRIAFMLDAGDLEFHDGERWVLEPGEFEVWVGPDSASGLTASFELRGAGDPAAAGGTR